MTGLLLSVRPQRAGPKFIPQFPSLPTRYSMPSGCFSHGEFPSFSALFLFLFRNTKPPLPCLYIHTYYIYALGFRNAYLHINCWVPANISIPNFTTALAAPLSSRPSFRKFYREKRELSSQGSRLSRIRDTHPSSWPKNA